MINIDRIVFYLSEGYQEAKRGYNICTKTVRDIRLNRIIVGPQWHTKIPINMDATRLVYVTNSTVLGDSYRITLKPNVSSA